MSVTTWSACNLVNCRVERLFHKIDDSVKEWSILVNLQLKKLPLVVSRFTALTGLLVSLFVSNVMLLATTHNIELASYFASCFSDSYNVII